ncbi:BDM_1a_G0043730.mRNA.1.CDS.1 [Saccharomyces cerevisiae]|nr:Fcp1p [Saccharomyces cerevisiae YJM1463]CAI4715207.1 BDM_1a_G0043730.mRNA.1.CDS.1 [Saccharomyces cerevisiae]CAI4988784.1 BBT_HP_G0070480.mRNA.1.CDS.1 [Saccharomyces cerevisiae]CAI5178021.1 BBT_HP_G0156380.mRNA.1.CDS.1 [Saccharomyces cerevisiae]CAI6850175.1 BBT_HP_G0070480.mRNA.1.CDS.1 [Saccharomyces cerevisiae]
MTTQIRSPQGLPYPIQIDKLIPSVGSYLHEGDRLLVYKFWYLVERASDTGDDDDEHDVSPGGSAGSNGVSPPTKQLRESIEFFESPYEGDLISWNVDVGDEVATANQVICEIKRPCNHDIVYGGLCTQCGKEVSADAFDGVPLDVVGDVDLQISETEAIRTGKALKEHLRRDKKLILVVDLDQTIIHCGVDPTIAEWKNDPNNPNFETLRDVKSFTLDEELVLPLMYMNDDGSMLRPPPVRKCWYYVKVRPGLKEFFAKVAPLFEMHIYTMATRAYALQIAKIVDPTGELFGDRILSRDENGSLTTKSLAKLFPTDQSMVVVIDDRGDVWNWCPNLIKVVPYNFFVGVGDINSNFLPKQSTGMLQLGRKTRQKSQESQELLTDIMDNEKKLQEKIDKEVKRQEEKLNHQLATAEEPPANESKEELTKKLEYSASLEVQQQNRPLAKLQKHLHDQKLLVDDDDELYYLMGTLSNIHKTYYDMLSQQNEPEPNLMEIIPSLKQKVFQNCYFVFSGLIPLGTDIQRSDIVIWTSTFGATSTPDIDYLTTHLITKNPSTYKARLAKKFNPQIKIVHPDWIFECLVNWKKVDEKPYTLIVDSPISDEELQNFQTQLQKRQEYLEETQEQQHMLTSQENLNLFAAGTSWLNNDDDEDIPDTASDDDEDDDHDDESDDENNSEGIDRKRSIEDNHDDTSQKKTKAEPSQDGPVQHKGEGDDNEDSDSQLEEELMDMLDD